MRKIANRLMLVAASICVLAGVPIERFAPAGVGFGESAYADAEDYGLHGFYIDYDGSCVAPAGVDTVIDHMFDHCNSWQFWLLVTAFIAAVALIGAAAIAAMPAATAGAATFATWVSGILYGGALALGVAHVILQIVGWTCNTTWTGFDEYCNEE